MIYGDWIGRWGRSHPDQEALVDAITGRRLTYGRMSDEINRLAHFLSGGLKVKKGDRVCCLSLNRVEYILLFFAASRIGAVLAPLNFRLAEQEYVYYLEDAAPKALFYDQDHAGKAAALKNRVQVDHWVCFDKDGGQGVNLPDLLKSHPADPPPECAIGPDDPQLIIYTSGTTGLPKGVVMTHGMIEANGLNTVLGWDLGPHDRTILHPAMFYTAGWNVFTLPLFQCRAVNVLVRGFEAGLILDLIQRERITLFFGVPTMYQMMIDSPLFEAADLSSLRFAVSGGAPLSRDIFETYQEQKGIHLWEGYGLTEVGPNNFMANGKPGTLGCPMPGVDIKLIDLDGHRVGQGLEGEILLRGRHMCAGYWNKPEATAQAIQNGWFHTGDLGRMDEDGHFVIAGRLKDMFISGGVNIYPAEIERLMEAHPDVAGAAVIGVPDPKWGEVGKVILELRPGAAMTLETLNQFLGDRLGRFKLPKYMVIVDELPRTPASGKIRKFILKKAHGGADDT